MSRLHYAYLAAWILMRAASRADAEAALHYVAPVGQKSEYVQRAIDCVEPYLAVIPFETYTA